jgi:3-hydroxyisobutyrate dehydrogenase-like beta-hydroxyacid dehydrogenase
MDVAPPGASGGAPAPALLVIPRTLACVDVGLLHPGEMGAAVGGAIRGRVLWASAGRSEATRSRAARFEDAGTLPALAGRSDVVLSVCPPEFAEDVAREVAACGFEGVFVDANATSPARAERIASPFARAVDGSITARGSIRLYLSGAPDDVELVRGLFDAPVEAVALPGGIGAASAIKMAFAGWNKIGAVLEAQAYAVARAYGLEEALEREGVDEGRVGRTAARAWRWSAEMHEIGDTHAALGLDDGIARGAAAALERWRAHRDDPSVAPERLLDELRGLG